MARYLSENILIFMDSIDHRALRYRQPEEPGTGLIQLNVALVSSYTFLSRGEGNAKI